MTQQTAHTSGSDLRRLDGSPVRVLVVDDEENLTELLRMALRYEGWDVRSAGTGMAAVRAAREFQPDAVALDMMLPDFDGMEVLRRMRADNPNVPVLFLTARDAVEDRVAGLTAGGDDYVTKPFSLEEVVARLRALMRRTAIMNEGSDSVLVVAGDLQRLGPARGGGHVEPGVAQGRREQLADVGLVLDDEQAGFGSLGRHALSVTREPVSWLDVGWDASSGATDLRSPGSRTTWSRRGCRWRPARRRSASRSRPAPW